MFCGGDDAQSAFLQVTKCSLQVVRLADRQGVQRTDGGLHGIAIDGHRAVRTYYNSVHTRAGTRTRYSTEVTYIRHAIQHHEERRLAFLIQHRDEVLHAVELHRREESDDALMVLVGILIEFLHGYALYGRSGIFQTRKQFATELRRHIASQQYFVNGLTCIDGLDDSMQTEYHLAFLRAASLVISYFIHNSKL